MKYLELAVGSILVYNFVLSRFLGICPFLGVSKRLSTALGMSGAVIAVMTMASAITAVIYKYLLRIEIALQKLSPKLYQALGIYLPLITTNCAVLGAATINANANRSILDATLFGCFSGMGFALALVLFSSLRERLDLAAPPRSCAGTPIALITAGILAMAFIGFSGLC